MNTFEEEVKEHYATFLDRDYFLVKSFEVTKIAYNNGYVPISFLLENSAENDIYEKEIRKMWPDAIIYREEHDHYVNVLSNRYESKTLESRYYDVQESGFNATFYKKEEKTVKDIISGTGPIIILDKVTNGHNVSNIAMLAKTFGASGILMTPSCAYPYKAQVVNDSFGSMLEVPFALLESWPDEDIKLIKSYGYKIAACALRKETLTLGKDELPRNEKIAIVMGNEQLGLDERVIDMCDYTIKIPMSGYVDSLNVSVAAGVVLFELCQ